MKIPYKPSEPKPPVKRITQDRIELNISDRIKACDIMTKALAQFKDQYGCYTNIKIKGDWQLDEIIIENNSDIDDGCCCHVVLIVTGGTISWDNPYYKSALRSYNKAIKQYPKKLTEYESKKVLYDEWKATNDKEIADKEKIKLQKDIQTLTKKLKKLS